MSWSETYKINNNPKRSINEQLRDMKFLPIKIVTQSTSYVPNKTGLYKVICVGAGGNGGHTQLSDVVGAGSGGGGGVAIKTLKLSKGVSYSITVGTTASFAYTANTIITATAGGGGTYSSGGSGGTASGGDDNYTGANGSVAKGSLVVAPATGSVGVFISDLTRTPSDFHIYYMGNQQLPYGDSIINYGGGATGLGYYEDSSNKGGYSAKGKPAAVLIIPLEMEE